MTAARATEPGLASVRREGDTLVLAGAIERACVAALWKQVRPLVAGLRLIDLDRVTRVDSAGLALLAELGDGTVQVKGSPQGLADLAAAYRLDAALGYTR